MQNNTEREQQEFQLLTPWTIGSLLIILLANLSLNWAQWQQKEAIKTANQARLPTKPSAFKLSPRLKLQSLSLVNGAKKRILTLADKEPLKMNTASLPVVQPKLSSKALPPAPQSITQGKRPNFKYPPLVKPIASKPNSVVIKPNALPIPSPPRVSNLPIKQSIEQNRLEAEQSNPLGFNHKTRAKIEATKTNQDPNERIQNMRQLQQERLNQIPEPSPIPSK